MDAEVPEREFDDSDIYGHDRGREALRPYLQRSTELAVVDTGLELGVKTVVVMSPTTYGIGTDLFNPTSIQILAYAWSALEHGRAVVVGEGQGVWDYVPVRDLANLYVHVVLFDILEKGGSGLLTGEKGIIFSENGRHLWMEVAQGVANECYEEGVVSVHTS